MIGPAIAEPANENAKGDRLGKPTVTVKPAEYPIRAVSSSAICLLILSNPAKFLSSMSVSNWEMTEEWLFEKRLTRIET
jgi:hypothetical protein